MVTHLAIGSIVGVMLAIAFVTVSYMNFLRERAQRGALMLKTYGPLDTLENPGGNVVSMFDYRVGERSSIDMAAAKAMHPSVRGAAQHPLISRLHG